MHTFMPHNPATGAPDSASPTSHHPEECAHHGTSPDAASEASLPGAVRTHLSPSSNTTGAYSHNSSDVTLAAGQGNLSVSSACGGPPGRALDRLELMEAGKKGTATSTASALPADHLHKTIRQLRTVGSASEAGSGTVPVTGSDSGSLSHTLKPKRRLDRNYSQPGKFRGVRYRGKGRYSAELKVKEVRRWLGIFTTAEEAARAFDRAAFEVRGKGARLNFPELIKGAEVHQSRDNGNHAGELLEDGFIDYKEDELTTCGGMQSSTPPAMAGKRETFASNRCFELQCDKDAGGADDVADCVITGCLEPISPRHQHDGLSICQGSRYDDGGSDAVSCLSPSLFPPNSHHKHPNMTLMDVRVQAQAKMLLMQRLRRAQSANSGSDGRSLPGEASGGALLVGGTAGKLEGLLLQVLPALLREGCNIGNGAGIVTATESSSSSLRGSGDIHATSASGTHRALPATHGLRNSSSSGNLNLLDSSNDLHGHDNCR